MPRINHLKNKLKGRTSAVGCILALPSAEIAEILAYAGFDCLFIDHEHGTGSLADAVAQMRAIKSTQTSSLVRIPAYDPAYIKRVLDAGADGVLCPSVESAAEAEAFVQACYFPPRGARGIGGGTRAARYGFDVEYPARLEDDILVAVTIETPRGVENAEEIGRVAGLDAIFIGPRDMSSALGKLGQFQDPEVLKLVEEAERRILASGKYLASVIYPGLDLQAMFTKGYSLVLAGMDVNLLVQGAKAALAQPR